MRAVGDGVVQGDDGCKSEVTSRRLYCSKGLLETFGVVVIVIGIQKNNVCSSRPNDATVHGFINAVVPKGKAADCDVLVRVLFDEFHRTVCGASVNNDVFHVDTLLLLHRVETLEKSLFSVVLNQVIDYSNDADFGCQVI